ncbi:MAG: hypothetical protein AAFY10_01145 [Pseudomonadota bacterium]
MEPLLIAAVAASVTGTVLEGAGQYIALNDEITEAQFNQEKARAESMEEYRLASAEGRRQLGAARVRAGGQGEISGSALDVLGELAAEGEYRANTALYQGRVRYDAFKAQAKAAKRARSLVPLTTAVNAGSTLLTAASSGGGGGGGGTASAGGTPAVAAGP